MGRWPSKLLSSSREPVPGKIEYHRNVDIYAAGLTFLAILQTKKGKKMLIPQIETPKDNWELHAPSIGLLIAERIKYKVPELNIVKVEREQVSFKWLISQITCVDQKKRLSAKKVFDILLRMEEKGAEAEEFFEQLGRILLNPSCAGPSHCT